MTRADRDVRVVCGLTLAATLMLFLPMPVFVQALIWAPVASFCPGYCLAAALFPRRSLSWAELLVVSVGLSLAVAILGGIVLHAWGLSLQQAVWAVLLSSVTLVAGAAASPRRAAFADPPSRVKWTMPDRHWMLLGLAGLIATGAIVLARSPVPAAGLQGYTSLWVLPDPQSGANHIRVGISSAELTSMNYWVEIVVPAGSSGAVARMRLEPGETWEASIAIPDGASGAGPIEVLLYLRDEPGVPYRRATLWP